MHLVPTRPGHDVCYDDDDDVDPTPPCMTLGIVDSDSSITYYKIHKGLVPPIE